MSINIVNKGALEARIIKAIKQMPTLTGDISKEVFVVNAIGYYLDALKKKKIIT